MMNRKNSRSIKVIIPVLAIFALFNVRKSANERQLSSNGIKNYMSTMSKNEAQSMGKNETHIEMEAFRQLLMSVKEHNRIHQNDGRIRIETKNTKFGRKQESGDSEDDVRSVAKIFTSVKPQKEFGGVIARPFQPWGKQFPLPCFPPEDGWLINTVQNSTLEEGFLYLKPYITDSNTASGINLRISRNIAKRLGRNYEFCKSRFQHGPGSYPASVLFHNRSKENSFLWTMISEPTHRAISAFFQYEVSRDSVDPTDANFQDYLVARKPHHKKDYYIRSLYTKGKFSRKTHDPVDVANQILDEYDFIGVTERMDESAVVLMMLLNLKLADVLYLSAKNYGGYDAGGAKNCTYIVPSFLSKGMRQFFSSPAWFNRVQYDFAFYEAVNQSLDLTIDRLGRAKFEANLKRFRKARSEIISKCRPLVVIPCEEGGKFSQPSEIDCLWKDSGCGTSCIDEVARELDLW